MSKKATEFQKKEMSKMYRGKEIFKPLNTGWIDENVACVREWVANIFFYRKGAVGMVHLYSPEVQNRCITLGLTTHEKIKRNALLFKAICVPGYVAYVLVCVYALNGARGFLAGFWQLLVILSIMNLTDRFLIDGYWVGHTNAWTIPGTEDLKPYITAEDKQKKWLFGTVGMAVIAVVLAAMMTAFIH